MAAWRHSGVHTPSMEWGEGSVALDTLAASPHQRCSGGLPEGLFGKTRVITRHDLDEDSHERDLTRVHRFIRVTRMSSGRLSPEGGALMFGLTSCAGEAGFG